MAKLTIFDADKAEDLFYWMDRCISNGDVPIHLAEAWAKFDPVTIPQEMSLVDALWKISNNNHF
jgi:hypothetical protein